MKTVTSVDGMPIKEGLDPIIEKERKRCLKILRPYLYVTDEKLKRTIVTLIQAVEDGVEL